MIVFPNSKINLGLTVTEKRPDGFHNIETVFYPVKWKDALEILPNDRSDFDLIIKGIEIAGKPEDNLLYKAWKMIREIRALPPLRTVLLKNIPMGAGLGGGSADAAFFIRLLNDSYGLSIPGPQLQEIASRLGSDCAFFIENSPVLAGGRGDEFTPVSVDLSMYYLLIVWPGVHSDTAAAYSGLDPGTFRKENIAETVQRSPVPEWKDKLFNRFETTVMKKYPVIKEVKDLLYVKGAVYASMSGSGSAVYGLFTEAPEVQFPKEFKYFLQVPEKKFS